jgi:hypothetical protein
MGYAGVRRKDFGAKGQNLEQLLGRTFSVFIRGVRRSGNFHAAKVQVGGEAASNNGPIAARAGLSIVAGQQVRNEGVDPAALVPGDFAVFVHGHVLAPANSLGAKDRFDGLTLQSFEQFALIILRHGRQFYSAAKSAQRYFGTTGLRPVSTIGIKR